jgi:hypothetical protein
MDELGNLRFIYVLLNNKRSNTHVEIDTGYRRINLNTQGQLNVLPQRLPLMSTNLRKVDDMFLDTDIQPEWHGISNNSSWLGRIHWLGEGYKQLVDNGKRSRPQRQRKY